MAASSLRPSAPAQLRQREVQRIAAEIGRAGNVEVLISRPGERVTGVYERAIDTPTGRHAVLRRQDSITIAPWTAALKPMRGRAVTGLVQPAKVAWTLCWSCAAGSRQVSVWRMQTGLHATARICTRFTAIPICRAHRRSGILIARVGPARRQRRRRPRQR